MSVQQLEIECIDTNGPGTPVSEYRDRGKAAKQHPSLNGLRFLAAMAVVCFHHRPLRAVPWVGRLIADGPAAVGFFFLLSGFVLALHHPQVQDVRKFWRARILRIYPMYLFAFLLFLPIALEKYRHDAKMLLASFTLNAFMLQAWTNLSQSWNGPSWSLSVEAFLYFVFPFLVNRTAIRHKPAAWALVALVPSALTMGFCFHWIPGPLWTGWMRNDPVFWLPLFCFGVALGLWRKQAAVPRGSVDLPLFVCLAVSVLLAFAWPVSYREVLINGAATPLFGFAVALCTFHAPYTQRLLGNAVMDRMGKASYITYIVQAPLWHYFQALGNLVYHRPLNQTAASIPEYLSFTVVLIGASLLLDVFIDEPLRKYLNGVWKMKPSSIGSVSQRGHAPIA